MIDALLRLAIGLLLRLSAFWCWLDWLTFLAIDWASETLTRRRWERARNETRRR
jgi:hypothetical protein